VFPCQNDISPFLAGTTAEEKEPKMTSWGNPVVDFIFVFIGFFVITVAASQLATVFPRIRVFFDFFEIMSTSYP
jgi:hypothetical protein